MPIIENTLLWYAVVTRPRWEKKIAKILENQGVGCYCPLNKVIKQWSDRKKVILEPVFKSYVFVNIEEHKKWEIKKIDGILNYVYWLGKPAVIRDEEINTIKKFLNDFNDVQIEQIGLHLNQKVRIKQGLLMNYEGVLLELFGNRAIVKIQSLNIQLNAQFNKRDIQPI
jgi:transcription antitermination factor NusG